MVLKIIWHCVIISIIPCTWNDRTANYLTAYGLGMAEGGGGIPAESIDRQHTFHITIRSSDIELYFMGINLLKKIHFANRFLSEICF